MPSSLHRRTVRGSTKWSFKCCDTRSRDEGRVTLHAPTERGNRGRDIAIVGVLDCQIDQSGERDIRVVPTESFHDPSGTGQLGRTEPTAAFA